MPGFPRIFPLVRISRLIFEIAHQNETVDVSVEMSFARTAAAVLWNVFVPDLAGFIDIWLSQSKLKILFSTF